VPVDPRSLAQAPPRISSSCVCARVLFVYDPSVDKGVDGGVKHSRISSLCVCARVLFVYNPSVNRSVNGGVDERMHLGSFCPSVADHASKRSLRPTARVLMCSLYTTRL